MINFYSGEEIKTLREKMDMNQQEFGDLIGVTIMAVSRWERGVSRPGRKARRQIKKILQENNFKNTK